MEKKDLIEAKKQEMKLIETQIAELEERMCVVREDIEELTAPEIPIEKIGKFLKQETHNSITVIRVDRISSSGDIYLPDKYVIQYHGYGVSRVKRQGEEIIRICNNSLITNYINDPLSIVEEISATEFVHYMNDATEAVQNKLVFNKD